jgi:hypothetical protein
LDFRFWRFCGGVFIGVVIVGNGEVILVKYIF